MTNDKRRKVRKQRGRPPTHRMPERIDASPEEIAEAVLRMPNKTDWRYMKDNRRGRQ